MVAYLVVNNGDIVFASRDVNKAHIYCERENNAGVMDELDDIGDRLDELTDEDIHRLAFSNSFNGGHHTVEKVTFSGKDEDEVFETESGNEFTYYEVSSALDKHSELDSNFYDAFDYVDFDEDEEDDFEDDDEDEDY